MSSDFASPILALTEGFALALSPCILPILPFILGSAVGGSRLRPFLIIAGFIGSFTVLALLSRQLLSLFGIDQENIQLGAYILLFIFGLVMVLPVLENRFAHLTDRIANKAQQASSGKQSEGVIGALLVGGLIGLVWTPCAGPILAAAILQVIQASSIDHAVITILAFSIGAGIPMLGVALFSQYLSGYIRSLAKHAVLLRRIMGGLILLISGLAIGGVNFNQWIAVNLTSNSGTSSEQHDTMTPYKAPKIEGITSWINSPALENVDLAGKVVLIDFWTYSCINCIRTLPHVERWYKTYKDKNFVVIGIHSPEFAFESKEDNVKQAIAKFGITYPVALDNKFVTWRNFKNEYWPAHYLINQQGEVVYTHFGEGQYDITENKIRELLGLSLSDSVVSVPTSDVISAGQTPETYLGTKRLEHFANKETPHHMNSQYSMPESLPLHAWGIEGSWIFSGDHLTSATQGSKLKLHFKSGRVFLVMGHKGPDPVQIRLKLNGHDNSQSFGKDVVNGMVTITNQRLYELVAQKDVTDSEIEIEALSPQLDLYAFTFGK